MATSKTLSKIGTKSVDGGDSFVAVNADLSNPNFSLPFFHYLSIPRSTPILLPVTFNMSLPIGIINTIHIETPLGCSGLVGIQVWRGVRQVFPLPEETWFKSDNSVYHFSFSHSMETEPYQITLRGYNLDDTYQHQIMIAFEMSGKSSDLPPQLHAFFQSLKG